MAQKTIYTQLRLIRPEWSHIRNRNGRYERICERLLEKWKPIDEMIERYGPERLGKDTMASINKEKETYYKLVLSKTTKSGSL